MLHSSPVPPLPARRRGFTLIELLVVMGIIALLAAISFPAVAGVRESTKRTGCMENMRHIVQALKMYKEDWGVYPDALYGYDNFTSTLEVPRRFLYPQYVDTRETFVCPNSRWKPPTQETVFDATTGVPTPPRVGTDTCMVHGRLTGSGGAQTVWYYYPWDTYDVNILPNTDALQNCGPANAPFAPANIYAEQHYDKQWSPIPDPRQLAIRNPVEGTVVTWCMNHTRSAVQPGNPNSVEDGALAVVAFIDGRVQTLPARAMLQWNGPAPNGNPWQVPPKP